MRESTTSQRLRTLMQERGLTQTEILDRYNAVARQLGEKPIGKGAMSYYVNGKVEPKQSKIYILAMALDVSEAWLMGYDVDRERIWDTLHEQLHPINTKQKPPVGYCAPRGIATRRTKSAEWEATLADIEHSRALGALDALYDEDERAVVEMYHQMTKAQKRRFKRLLEIIKEEDEEE